MGKRLVGAVFYLMAALLFASWYVAAAMFMSGGVSWNADRLAAGLEYVGLPLPVLSALSLAVGIAYLVWAEVSDWRRR